ncbi:cuticle protein 16.8-like isoform X1 [Ornithodoros turicata]|uniref:cuticle protein 16.8-like isoform X1 n=1 Tax=Ornithodoros turicata TaxID=34597 RepID=UPI0031389E78
MMLQIGLLLSALAAFTHAGYVEQEVYAPQPYQFGYETQDEYGNRQSRHEQDAGNGVKTGSYGYRDAHGLYRQVQYVADAAGFRAWVKTNEPGTVNSAPAGVQIESDQSPAAVLTKAAAVHIPVHVPRVAPVAVVAPVASAPVHAFQASHPVYKAHHGDYAVRTSSLGHVQQAYSHQVPAFQRLAVAPASPTAVVQPLVAVQSASPLVATVPRVARRQLRKRRPKPAEFFKKSIVRKARVKVPPKQVVVVGASGAGVRTTTVLPVYKDK